MLHYFLSLNPHLWPCVEFTDKLTKEEKKSSGLQEVLHHRLVLPRRGSCSPPNLPLEPVVKEILPVAGLYLLSLGGEMVIGMNLH